MDENALKELFFLQRFLDDEQDGIYGPLHYRSYLDEGNFRIQRGIVSLRARESFFMPENPEHSELDWWILLALNNLKVADADSVLRYLRAEKKLHPELLMNLDDPRLVKRRLNLLTRLGFVLHFAYMTNTDITLSEAEERYKAYRKEIEDERIRKSASDSAIDLSDAYMYEEDDEDEQDLQSLGYFSYKNASYSRELDEKKEQYFVKSLGVLGDGARYQTFFGGNSRIVDLYMLEFATVPMLKIRFGKGIAADVGNFIYRMPAEVVGFASTGYLASRLSDEKTFHNFLTGSLRTKNNGNFQLPSELMFKVDTKDGTYTYDVGLFYSYYLQAKGRELPYHAESDVRDTIYAIKNFIGVKANLKKPQEKRDAVAVVAVNDTQDLLQFLELYKDKATEAEENRVFFTGEGIINSPVGLKRVIGFQRDENSESGYKLFPTTLPFII